MLVPLRGNWASSDSPGKSHSEEGRRDHRPVIPSCAIADRYPIAAGAHDVSVIEYGGSLRVHGSGDVLRCLSSPLPTLRFAMQSIVMASVTAARHDEGCTVRTP
jgi:hypothetical protein